jgi:hypothetical protein
MEFIVVDVLGKNPEFIFSGAAGGAAIFQKVNGRGI